MYKHIRSFLKKHDFFVIPMVVLRGICVVRTLPKLFPTKGQMSLVIKKRVPKWPKSLGRSPFLLAASTRYTFPRGLLVGTISIGIVVDHSFLQLMAEILHHR